MTAIKDEGIGIVKNPGAEFCKIVLAWKSSGKLEPFFTPEGWNPDDGAPMDALFNGLLSVKEPVPDHIAQALGLPAGASYGALYAGRMGEADRGDAGGARRAGTL